MRIASLSARPQSVVSIVMYSLFYRLELRDTFFLVRRGEHIKGDWYKAIRISPPEREHIETIDCSASNMVKHFGQ